MSKTLRLSACGGNTWAVYRDGEFLGFIDCEADSEVDPDLLEAAEREFPAPHAICRLFQ